MAMTFVLSGDGAPAAGEVFKAALDEAEPGIDVATHTSDALSAPARKVIDPISLAALVLSVPSAILAVVDLADRIKKRRRAQQLIDEAKRLRSEKSVTVFVLDAGNPKPLDGLSPDDLLDIARDT